MNIDENSPDHEDNMVESSDEEGMTFEKTKINESTANLLRGKSRGTLDDKEKGDSSHHHQQLSNSDYASF